MILTRILRVRTVGSVETRDLRPVVADHLLPGVNLKALEYDEEAMEAIVEIWGSNHPFVSERILPTTLATVAEHETVLEVLGDHPESGGYKLGLAAGTVNIDPGPPVKVTRGGVPVPFIRIEEGRRGRVVILEELPRKQKEVIDTEG